ncbi:MAG: polysaccharide deacetylase family protein [Gemmatimonadales bacterium]|nr:MAG: polysaccharide deacetylase family protein [Gemmatimonadales bacterium]
MAGRRAALLRPGAPGPGVSSRSRLPPGDTGGWRAFLGHCIPTPARDHRGPWGRGPSVAVTGMRGSPELPGPTVRFPNVRSDPLSLWRPRPVRNAWKPVFGVLLALVGLAVLVASVSLAVEWRQNAAPDCRVGAFMYHAVVPDSAPGRRFDIRHSDFVRHLEELHEAGVNVVDPQLADPGEATLARAIDEWCSDSSRVALITFDAETPSYHSELSVPPLRTMGMQAAYFVVTGFLDAEGWVSRDDVEVMLEAGMRVGSHSHEHPLMTRVPREVARADLSRSIAELRTISAGAVPMLALPGGRFDEETLVTARELGFVQVFNSAPCYLTPELPVDRICRIEVRGDGGPSPAQFLESPFRVGLQGWSWRWKRRIERMAGERIWNSLSGMRYGE